MITAETKRLNSTEPVAEADEFPRFVCPKCRAALARGGASQYDCRDCGAGYIMEGSVWNMLPPARHAEYEQFLAEYRAVRRAEGRTSIGPAALRELPSAPSWGRPGRAWKIRARSFEAFVDHVLVPSEKRSDRPLRILDAGAGNGWLAHRTAQRGHRAVALDLQTDSGDGLGAVVHYEAPLTAVIADFDSLPFANASFDMVVFNASFHYSTAYERTMAEAFRVLNDGGTCVILDTPIYQDAQSGEAMVREREQEFERRFGFRSNSLQSENYLTWDRLHELSRRLNIEWRSIRPDYGLRWRIRPLIARILRRRKPAAFVILHARKRSHAL